MKREDEWLDKSMTKKDKNIIIFIIITAFILLNLFSLPFRKLNMHAINYVSYYAEFGFHVVEDKLNNTKTEFEFKPINIGHINFGIDEKIDELKSDTITEYNSTAIGDNISKEISGYSMNEAMNKISSGY